MLLLSILLLLLLAPFVVNVHGLTAHHHRPPLLAAVAIRRQNFVAKQQCCDDNAASSSTMLCITSMWVNSNNARWRTIIMDMARGGGEDEKSDDEYDDNDASDNDETDVEDTNENEVVIDERMESSISGNTTPDNAASSSSSYNLGLVVALWSSLVFDTILNKSKRLVLFPTTLSSTTLSSTTTTTTVLATAQLSSGFALAVGVAFLLWRDVENRIERSGDSFLSLSSSSDGVASSINKEEEEETVARRIRIRLLLHLAIFGLLCLTGQSMGYYFSNHAPFLGLSAAAVNIHNVLTCISALMKEVKQGGGGTTNWSMQQLFQSSSKDERRNIAHRSRLEWTPFLFCLGTVTACVRCLVVGKDIIALTMGLLSSVGGVGAATITIVSNARLLSLQVATLARLTLFAGVTNVLHSVITASSTVKDKDYLRHHPFFATLSGILGLGCLGVGGMIMLETFLLSSSSSVSVNAIISNQPEVLGGVLLMIFGSFASWNSVLGIKRHICSVATSS